MITLNAIEKNFGSKIIYNGISASFHPSHRTGLAGPNGAGKTLLLRILMGEESVDKGQVVIPAGLRLGYLPQEMHIELDRTPVELVLQPFAHLFEIEASCERLSLNGDINSVEYQRAAAEFDRFQDQLHVHDVYSLEPRAKTFLTGLGVPPENWDLPTHDLSGGFRMRVMLAQLLLLNPDVLLLDEPTNHLDMDSLIWLEKFLQRFKGGVLVVSHDRDFLNRVTDHTAELLGGMMTQFNGPIERFFEWKREVTETDGRRAKSIQDQIDKAEQFIDRFKSKNTKAATARSKMKVVERLKEQLPDQVQSYQNVRFHLKESIQSGLVPVKIEDISVAYEGRDAVFNGVSLSVNRGDKIAILGPNGVGKSTLLKACAGLIDPAEGTITLGHNTEMRYFSQHRLDQLDPGSTLYETISRAANTSVRLEIQSILGSFMFSGDEVEKKVSVLSGGEKSRLSLATILANPGNLLLLDEPTNHLDIESIERLVEVLQRFSGTLVIVSHDEYLVTHVANRIIEMRKGSFRDFPGTLGEYRSYIENGYLADLETTGKSDTKKPSAQTGKELSKQERIRRKEERTKCERKLQRIEVQIAEGEQKIEIAKNAQNDPANGHDYQKLQELAATVNELDGANEQLMKEWTALSLQLEELQDSDS